MTDSLTVHTYDGLSHIESRIESLGSPGSFLTLGDRKQRRLIEIVRSLEEQSISTSSANGSRTLFSLSRYGPSLFNMYKSLISKNSKYQTVASFLSILKEIQTNPSLLLILNLFGPENYCPTIQDPEKHLFITTLGLPVSDELITRFQEYCSINKNEDTANKIVNLINEVKYLLRKPEKLHKQYLKYCHY